MAREHAEMGLVGARRVGKGGRGDHYSCVSEHNTSMCDEDELGTCNGGEWRRWSGGGEHEKRSHATASGMYS